MLEISTRNLLNLSQHGENRGLDQCLHAQLYCSMNARNNRGTCRKDEKERERWFFLVAFHGRKCIRGRCPLSSPRNEQRGDLCSIGLMSVHVSRRGYQGQIVVVVMHRLDQLPLVVRLPLENDLSWIVLLDEIYRACL